MSVVVRWLIVVVCQLEVFAIMGAIFGIAFLRRLPTVSHVAGRFWPFGVLVLLTLAWHFWTARPTIGG